jgi:hypothetical protein
VLTTTSPFKNGSREPMGYFMVTKLMEFSKSGSYSASISIILVQKQVLVIFVLLI